MKKSKYKKPLIEIINIETEGIIAVSGIPGGGDIPTPRTNRMPGQRNDYRRNWDRDLPHK